MVDYAGNRLSGPHLAAVNHHPMMVLDRNLPRPDGMSLCRRLREDRHSAMPQLVLLARGSTPFSRRPLRKAYS